MQDCCGKGLKETVQLLSSFCSLECVLSYRKKLESTEGAYLQPLHFKPAVSSAHLLLFKAKLF